jgi:hypothetical protein
LNKTNNEIMAAKQQQRTSLTYFAWRLGIGYPMIEPLWNSMTYYELKSSSLDGNNWRANRQLKQATTRFTS